MIENFEQKFKDLDYNKAKREYLLFINLFAVDPGKMDFEFQELINLQNSAALTARYKKLAVMATGQDLTDFWKAVPVTTFQKCKIHLSLWNKISVQKAFSIMKFVYSPSTYQIRLTHMHFYRHWWNWLLLTCNQVFSEESAAPKEQDLQWKDENGKNKSCKT